MSFISRCNEMMLANEKKIAASRKSHCVCLCVLCAGRGDPEAGDADGRRAVRYPDSHQLFVGNLPHDIDESELKEFFMSKCDL